MRLERLYKTIVLSDNIIYVKFILLASRRSFKARFDFGKVSYDAILKMKCFDRTNFVELGYTPILVW